MSEILIYADDPKAVSAFRILALIDGDLADGRSQSRYAAIYRQFEDAYGETANVTSYHFDKHEGIIKRMKPDLLVRQRSRPPCEAGGKCFESSVWTYTDRPVSRLEIIEAGGRRRFSDEAKLEIVAESYSGPRMGSATARKHGITRSQLNEWRRAVEVGRLGPVRVDGFIPALIVPEVRRRRKS